MFETFEHTVVSLKMSERMYCQETDHGHPAMTIYGYERCLDCRNDFFNSEVGVRLDNRNSVTKPSFFLSMVLKKFMTRTKYCLTGLKTVNCTSTRIRLPV